MLKEFREFILRGNVVDLAIAVVIGAAFGAVVAASGRSFVTPLIAAIGGKPDFERTEVHDQRLGVHLRHFLNAVISFLIIAAVIFFFVVKPLNAFLAAASRRTCRRSPRRRPRTCACSRRSATCWRSVARRPY